uniref:Adenosine deaminase tRNA specific 3 n=1 Tax=Cyprinus carpio TaxID=7962 RepID=A0A8C1RS35_CYPCA
LILCIFCQKEMDKYDTWDVLPVLSDEQSRDTELLPTYAAPIIEKRQTSRLVKELSLIYPLPGLQHIKRVRACKDKSTPHPLEVIVCLARDVQVIDCKEVTLADLLHSQSFDSIGLGEPFLVKIPANPSLTRPQFEKDKQVTSALRGQLFTAEQKAKVQEYMTAAVEAGEPEQIVAVGHDCKCGSHPLHHAVMVCIDLMACGQGGGAYNYEKYPVCRFSSSESFRNACYAKETGQPYICTGYDLYVTGEPCVMCAMALVHTRIKRVFYGAPSTDGAFRTKYKIHLQKDLNHHFEVYEGVMRNACEALFKIDR